MQSEMTRFTLKKDADIGRRLDALKLVFDACVSKVMHCDKFRQQNMNYALALFAGLMAFRTKLDAPWVISLTLFVLMIIFCVWDRRWHRTKHGWDSAANKCYTALVELTNNPDQDVTYCRYDTAAEADAEWTSWQPIVFYLLVAASAASFFVH
ncbi:MAG: hypothetical protein U1D30_06845 [Planctomycetota bacterium]